jgi:hypothetical protein
MAIHRRTRRFLWLLALSCLLGLLFFAATSPRGVVETVIVFVGSQLGGFATVFLPYGIVYLGWRRLHDQRGAEFEALGDDNTVTADPEGPRKLHEYLTAITSTEARIGLLQRSEPYPGDPPKS